jgi:hypothetical protein
MARYTLVARIDGKFPFDKVQFSKNHRPIPIEGTTYYLRLSSCGKRTPIKIGKDVGVAYTALIQMEDGSPSTTVLFRPLGGCLSFPPLRLGRRCGSSSRIH